MTQTKEVKSVMTIALVVNGILGFSMGVYEATCGAYFYERFGSVINPARAIMLATLLLAVRQGLITLLEMPSGALADTIGRVQVIVISWAARAAFFMCLAALWFCKSIATAMIWGSVASMLWAISYTFFNGAFSAWCVDYLKQNSQGYSYSLLTAHSQNYYAIASAIGTPIGILFYLSGLPALVYAIVGILCFLCMSFCLLQMKETASTKFIDRYQISAKEILKKMKQRLINASCAFRKCPVLFWIVFTFGSFMFMLNIVRFLWPIFLKETTGAKQFSPLWIGLAMVCGLIGTLSPRLLIVLNNKLSRRGSSYAQKIKTFSRSLSEKQLSPT